jgi:hypothetical protein
MGYVNVTLRYKFFAHPMMSSTVTSLTQKSTYEFTKRKRWPDLLINGLVDSVLFILSPSCTVLYVATAVNELLGWRDVDLVDLDFIKLVNRTLQVNSSHLSNSSYGMLQLQTIMLLELDLSTQSMDLMSSPPCNFA